MVPQVQQDAAKALRSVGLGYGRIASILGVPVSQVRSLVQDVPVKANPSDAEGGRWCAWCGKPLRENRMGRPSRFCSGEHRRAWWSYHPEARTQTATYDYECVGCGAAFTAYGNTRRKYCSHGCYVKHRGRAS
ncbi:MAG: RNA polymerase subunit sigma-70 [Mobiluncus sp.]|uniref:hypothetical protein n=1 Tax=Mobiluncus sp. TaxID=47293 RepID=UPI00258F3437|nr:hypothetical protein [Mobiluncus sp.]MCI6584805.1 RNA polymerase subunit sigma-70 [Mobiluncus sp.]